MSKIVVAFGGNALGKNPQEQQKLINKAVINLIPLIKEGHKIIITHGNGPQVGIINLAFEDSYENKNIPYMSFPECTAMSQGYIGFHLQKGLRNLLKENNITKKIVTIITQVTVDENDLSFKNPTKPVGPFYTKEVADILMKESGEKYIEDAGRGYRKVVASPNPISIIEIDTIKDLIDSNHIVIACGGGGIPVYSKDNYKSANAVIDKDKVSSLMASKLQADKLIILTDVSQACLNYGTKQKTPIGSITIDEAKKYIEEGHFAKGSMLPKIESAISFAEKTGNSAVITELDNITNAMLNKNVTEIHK